MESIHRTQRRNGKIIFQTLLEVEPATTETITDKICCDFNIFHEKTNVENVVKKFIREGYYSGFIDANQDRTYEFNRSLKQNMVRENNISTLDMTRKNKFA
ncbi:hypothetical protein ACKWTF_010155 [Chironomus riparius]